jgi:C4-type Zn-finger protein
MLYPSPEQLPWLLRTLLAGPDGKCAQCGAAVIAPEWSEHISAGCLRNVWRCDTCGYRYEDTIYLPVRDQAETR